MQYIPLYFLIVLWEISTFGICITFRNKEACSGTSSFDSCSCQTSSKNTPTLCRSYQNDPQICQGQCLPTCGSIDSCQKDDKIYRSQCLQTCGSLNVCKKVGQICQSQQTCLQSFESLDSCETGIQNREYLQTCGLFDSCQKEKDDLLNHYKKQNMELKKELNVIKTSLKCQKIDCICQKIDSVIDYYKLENRILKYQLEQTKNRLNRLKSVIRENCDSPKTREVKKCQTSSRCLHVRFPQLQSW